MYEIIFYDTADGKCPVQDFLDSLDSIFELRTKHGSDINRVFYFFIIGQKIILTNGIIKKTNKTPKSAIDLAKKYKTDYEWRHRNEQL